MWPRPQGTKKVSRKKKRKSKIRSLTRKNNGALKFCGVNPKNNEIRRPSRRRRWRLIAMTPVCLGVAGALLVPTLPKGEGEGGFLLLDRFEARLLCRDM